MAESVEIDLSRLMAMWDTVLASFVMNWVKHFVALLCEFPSRYWLVSFCTLRRWYYIDNVFEVSAVVQLLVNVEGSERKQVVVSLVNEFVIVQLYFSHNL